LFFSPLQLHSSNYQEISTQPLDSCYIPLIVSIMDTDANQRLAVLFIIHVINKLKQIQRTGWIRMLAEKGVRPESVADHSFGVALLGLFAPLDFDYTKCVAMGVVHDLAEGFVGDMPTYAKIDKSKLRSFSSRELC
jgi:hypothetical protein